MLYMIQNDPEVPPGLLGEELDRLGAAWTIVHPYRGDALPKVLKKEALVVLGGAMGANDDSRHPFLTGLKALIRDTVARDIPYLGVCLGGQLLAAALETPVVSNRWEELGTREVTLSSEGRADPLFQGIDDTFVSFQWHHDSFDIPLGAVLLAGSPACPHQAFRVGRTAWGLQFHPEADERIVREWSSWTPETSARTDEFVAAYKAREAAYRLVVQRMTENFLAACLS